MSYLKSYSQMDLTDRLAIETGLCRGDSFKRIARTIGRHPSTVAHEVLENRTYIMATFHGMKDCYYAGRCKITNLCQGHTKAVSASVNTVKRRTAGRYAKDIFP